jgi:hypothetical protein
MFNNVQTRLWLLGLIGAACLLAQDAALPNCSVSIDVPNDAPVALLGISNAPCSATAHGAALMLDLHLSLTLKNTGSNRIHGVTLRVVSQEVALGGVGSVYQPSLNVGPGEAFPVHIDTQLMRPAQLAGGPAVQVHLDGVLFQDLTFYGPDRLHSRRIMTAGEMEAQRDREYLKRLLAEQGLPALRQAMLRIRLRQDSVPRLQGRVARGHTVTTAGVAAAAPEHQEKFAFLQFPDSPVEPVEGSLLIAGNEARMPTIDVRNRSGKVVKYVELGWVLTDPAGHDYMAGSMPSTDSSFSLAPGSTARVRQDSTLGFSTGGQPVSIQKMTGFVTQVEFADGKVWVPNRQNLENPFLVKILAPSIEEERLASLYVRKGVDAVVEELKKF